MDAKILEDIGLTPAEARLYLALLETGQARAGQLLEKSGLQNSVMHAALGGLQRQGLVSFQKEGRTRTYEACNPRLLLDLLDERKQKLKTLLSTMKPRHNRQTRNEAMVFYGFNGFKAAHYQMIEGVARGSEWNFFSFLSESQQSMDLIHAFYKQFEYERAERGITVRGVAPKSWAPYYLGRKADNILLVDIPLLHNINICADRVILTPWDDGEVCFLMYSRTLASHFRSYFQSIWHKFKK